MRKNLIRARKEAGLTQQQFADAVGTNRTSVVAWEAGTREPDPLYYPLVRVTLNKSEEEYPDLFANSSEEESFMDRTRRALAQILGISGTLVATGSTSIVLAALPHITPEEYIAQCKTAIAGCWTHLKHGEDARIDDILTAYTPSISRLAMVVAPFRKEAARLTTEAMILRICLATHEEKYSARETFGHEAIKYAGMSGDRLLLATTQSWHAHTYKYCYRQPQTAIAHFNDALSSLEGENASLNQSDIYIGLATAYAQDGNVTQAVNYAGMAQASMPTHPELDPLYKCIGIGQSELDLLEGKMYLYLAEAYPNDGYGQLAYNTFNKATSLQSTSSEYHEYQVQAFIYKADASIATGDRGHFVDCLTNAVSLVPSQQKLGLAHEVLTRVPAKWREESAIQNLQKDVTHALVVARRNTGLTMA